MAVFAGWSCRTYTIQKRLVGGRRVTLLRNDGDDVDLHDRAFPRDSAR